MAESKKPTKKAEEKAKKPAPPETAAAAAPETPAAAAAETPAVEAAPSPAAQAEAPKKPGKKTKTAKEARAPPAPDANQRFVHCKPSASTSPSFATSRRCRTMAVGHRNSGASDFSFLRLTSQRFNESMGRYTGPKTRISRRYVVPIFGSSKSLE